MSSRLPAHLVDEYSSMNDSSMNVLSPEVSLSEGNSPIRVEAQASGSPNNLKVNGGNSTNVHEDNVTITVEDGSLPEEDESYS